MADIDVERKKSGPVWPWIVGLLLLGLLIWGIAEMVRTDDPAPVAVDDRAPVAAEPAPAREARQVSPEEASAPVRSYLDSCGEEEPGEMGLQHQYTVRCIRQLESALSAVTEQDTVGVTAIQPPLQELGRQADRLEASDPRQVSHAGMARDAFTAATEVLTALQQARHPDVREVEDTVSEARLAAGAVAPQQPLLEQRGATQRFFEHAGESLRWFDRGNAAGPTAR